MLAGLWGAKNVQRRNRLLGRAMVWSMEEEETSQNENYETDQSRLDLFVWPFAISDVV